MEKYPLDPARIRQLPPRFSWHFGAVGKPDLNAGALDIFLSGLRLLSAGRGDGPPHRSGDSGIFFFVDRLCIEWMGETLNPQNLERSGSDIICERQRSATRYRERA